MAGQGEPGKAGWRGRFFLLGVKVNGVHDFTVHHRVTRLGYALA